MLAANENAMLAKNGWHHYTFSVEQGRKKLVVEYLTGSHDKIFAIHKKSQYNQRSVFVTCAKVMAMVLQYSKDISLYDSLTFREMAVFFGKLYNMPQQDLKLQVKFLAHLLDMTSIDQQIETLSGGGKRRVSLALTLIHSPDLLILDEPCSYVIFLLYLWLIIWEHLYNLALNHGKTVVITTHYTEEAKLANKIGIMRNGRFLAEDTPANLIQAFNCNLLEEVTLKLCRADEISNQISSDTSPATQHKMNIFKFKSSWKETVTSAVAKHDGHSVGVFKRSTEFDTIITNDVEIPRFNLSRRTSRLDSFFHELKKVQGIAMVQGLSVLRQKVFLAFFVLLPTIQGSIMFNTMGRQPRLMKVGVVNNELLNWTSQCNSESFVNESCDFTFLSCKFIHEIQSSDIVNLIPFNSEEDARPKALEGHVKGYITFPANFSDYTLESLATRPFPSNESMDGSRIGMHLDFSQYVESLFMLQHFLESHSIYLQHLAESCQINKNVARVPFEFRKPVYESLDDSYTEFFVPGIMLCAIIVCVASITAILYLNDKNNGTLGRGQVAGLKTGHILLGLLMGIACSDALQSLICKNLLLDFPFQVYYGHYKGCLSIHNI
ncbi:ABC transporter G family member 23 [Orchesella cincta]|uniref:ABC transporter G family member 23 n=1 Tax=Orchesella cincta TaxID=48709 RepID=A0A1D2MF65_ORCCI|nr:ABC transporter G family member 23 [Orchesella cincta]